MCVREVENISDLIAGNNKIKADIEREYHLSTKIQVMLPQNLKYSFNIFSVTNVLALEKSATIVVASTF